MKIEKVIMAAIAAIAVHCQMPANAAVVIHSPTQGETRSDSTVYSHGLHWDPRSQTLSAVITYSNTLYVLQADPVQENTFAFPLPGVHFDSQNDVFYVVSRNGERTPIAEYRSGIFGKQIRMLPGATVYSRNDHGNVSVQLKAAGHPTGAPHWVEYNGIPQ